jgi:hypothetical protein
MDYGLPVLYAAVKVLNNCTADVPFSVERLSATVAGNCASVVVDIYDGMSQA